MQVPCEIIVRHVLPTVRAMVAKELIENYGFTQSQAAEKLDITQAAVSWYLSYKRGRTKKKGLNLSFIESFPQIRKTVTEMAKGIAKEDLTPVGMIMNFCGACTSIRESSDDFCRMHVKAAPSIKDCTICHTWMCPPAVK